MQLQLNVSYKKKRNLKFEKINTWRKEKRERLDLISFIIYIVFYFRVYLCVCVSNASHFSTANRKFIL
jgi:hypothetical protein